MATEQELQKAKQVADARLRNVKGEYDNAIYNAKRDAATKIRLFFDSIYEETIVALQTAAWDADTALKVEQERLALTGDKAPYPLGTRLKKTTGRRFSPKTVYGMLEAVTRDTEYQDNLARYSRPAIGSFVVRLLKTDGTLSKKIDVGSLNWWTPVDETIVRKEEPVYTIEI